MIEYEGFVHQMKKFISDTLNELFQFNIRMYTINFSKKLAKNAHKKILDFETKLKYFEKYYENYVDNIDYKILRQQVDVISI